MKNSTNARNNGVTHARDKPSNAKKDRKYVQSLNSRHLRSI